MSMAYDAEPRGFIIIGASASRDYFSLPTLRWRTSAEILNDIYTVRPRQTTKEN